MDKMPEGKIYLVEDYSLRLIESVSKRLYDMKRLNADEMRDCANKLNLFIHHHLIEYKEGSVE